MLPLIQPQLSPPLQRGHIYVFSFSQILGYLNLMKVNFVGFFLPSLFLPLKNQVSKSGVGGSCSEEVQRNPRGYRKRYLLEVNLLYLLFMSCFLKFSLSVHYTVVYILTQLRQTQNLKDTSNIPEV